MLEAAGPEGQAVLHDIDVFISGINDYLADSGSSNAPWTRNDVYALNALKGQFVGQGGGDEARRSQFLGGLAAAARREEGHAASSTTCASSRTASCRPRSTARFPYGTIPEEAPRAA